MMALAKRFTLVVMLLDGAGCGGPRENTELAVGHPLLTARINSYTGWLPGPWHQEVWIQLQPNVELNDVADLRVFGPLRPGMSLEQAIAVAGEPSSQSSDYRGTDWNIWPNVYGFVQVGCVESCSGSDCFEKWQLQGHPKERDPASVFHKAIAEVVIEAIERKPEVEFRLVHVATREHTEKLSLVVESKWGEYLWWGPSGAECGMADSAP